jgi:hypothetical protein
MTLVDLAERLGFTGDDAPPETAIAQRGHRRFMSDAA